MDDDKWFPRILQIQTDSDEFHTIEGEVKVSVSLSTGWYKRGTPPPVPDQLTMKVKATGVLECPAQKYLLGLFNDDLPEMPAAQNFRMQDGDNWIKLLGFISSFEFTPVTNPTSVDMGFTLHGLPNYV